MLLEKINRKTVLYESAICCPQRRRRGPDGRAICRPERRGKRPTAAACSTFWPESPYARKVMFPGRRISSDGPARKSLDQNELTSSARSNPSRIFSFFSSPFSLEPQLAPVRRRPPVEEKLHASDGSPVAGGAATAACLSLLPLHSRFLSSPHAC